MVLWKILCGNQTSNRVLWSRVDATDRYIIPFGTIWKTLPFLFNPKSVHNQYSHYQKDWAVVVMYSALFICCFNESHQGAGNNFKLMGLTLLALKKKIWFNILLQLFCSQWGQIVSYLIRFRHTKWGGIERLELNISNDFFYLNCQMNTWVTMIRSAFYYYFFLKNLNLPLLPMTPVNLVI